MYHNSLAHEGEHGLARNTDPDTSHDAAAQVDASGLMREIYVAMETFGYAGCTADDVEDYLNHLQNWTISPRYKQMVERGMIEVTGEKRTGKSNRMLMVRRVLKPPFIRVIDEPVICPCCDRKTRSEKAIERIRANTGLVQGELL